MAKNKITDYSATNASNTDLGGIDIQGTGYISNGDNAFREIMTHLAETNAGTFPVADTWSFADPADLTKIARFDCGSIATATTRVLTMPDRDVALAGDQSWILISKTIISSAASWTATDLSGYHTLRITGYIRPATDGTAALLRTSSNNGSSYDSSASDYSWQVLTAANTTVAGSRNTASSGISFSGTLGNANDEGANFSMIIQRFNVGRQCLVKTETHLINASAEDEIRHTVGRRLDSSARDAVQILMASGNIAGGVVYLEGMA